MSNASEMVYIDTLVGLRAAWPDIARQLYQDVDRAYHFRQDPNGICRSLGYDLTPEVARVLREALP